MTKPDARRRRLLGGLSALSLSSGGVLAGASALAQTPRAGPHKETGKGSQRAPNVVFILADDLGWGDLGVYGQTDFQTPQLDRLARQGIRFTQAYANSAVCSATRFALITGRYQYRLRGGLEEPLAGGGIGALGLPPEHPTLPSLLKAAGYRTALLGKWHLGALPTFGPLKSGYDLFFGNHGGAIDYFTHKAGVGENVREDLYEGEVPVKQVGYYTDLLGDRAVDYIARQSPAQPFFLSLHFTAPHWPWEGPQDEAVSRQIKSIFHYDGGSLGTYGRMVGALDTAVGRVLKALKDRKLDDNTIVVFTSDNGGERFSRTWPFSGQKTELLEGGVRVPLIVRWPGRIQAGRVSEQVTISMDWLPTLLDAAGSRPDPAHASDGENLLPTLLDAHAPLRERTLFWRYKVLEQRAVRSGDWKYLRINGQEFLFDVARDPRERANLRERHPEVFERLKQRWEDWNAGMLPITDDIRSIGVDADKQADHYGSPSGGAQR